MHSVTWQLIVSHIIHQNEIYSHIFFSWKNEGVSTGGQLCEAEIRDFTHDYTVHD